MALVSRSLAQAFCFPVGNALSSLSPMKATMAATMFFPHSTVQELHHGSAKHSPTATKQFCPECRRPVRSRSRRKTLNPIIRFAIILPGTRTDAPGSKPKRLLYTVTPPMGDFHCRQPPGLSRMLLLVACSGPWGSSMRPVDREFFSRLLVTPMRSQGHEIGRFFFA